MTDLFIEAFFHRTGGNIAHSRRYKSTNSTNLRIYVCYVPITYYTKYSHERKQAVTVPIQSRDTVSIN